MKKVFTMKPASLAARLWGLFLLGAMLLSSVSAVVFSHPFYQTLYNDLQLAEAIGVSQDDLEASIFMMTDYVEGKREDLTGQIVRYGQTQETFNEKEKRHMKDVRTLWLKARAVMIASWILCALSGVFILWRYGGTAASELYRGLLSAIFVGLGLLLFFGFWMMSDFTSFWTWFHTIVFPGNMDWLLDPAVDFMIVICPEAMFSQMIFQIALRLVLGTGGVLLLLWWLNRTLPPGFQILCLHASTQKGK